MLSSLCVVTFNFEEIVFVLGQIFGISSVFLVSSRVIIVEKHLLPSVA